jgi:phosphoglycolate phosphatase
VTIKAVIFDLDGTIASFNLDYKTLRADVRGYLMKMGVPASLISIKENIFEMLKKTELFMVNTGKSEANVQEIRQESFRIAEKYELEAAMNTNLVPGAVNTLQELKKAGLKMALCTINSANSTDHILNRFRIGEYFDAVIPRNKVSRFKPHPEHCKSALSMLEVEASETMLVGDSVTDMEAASEIKVTAIGLPTGVASQKELVEHGANYIVTSITDLPVLIGKINQVSNEAN